MNRSDPAAWRSIEMSLDKRRISLRISKPFDESSTFSVWSDFVVWIDAASWFYPGNRVNFAVSPDLRLNVTAWSSVYHLSARCVWCFRRCFGCLISAAPLNGIRYLCCCRQYWIERRVLLQVSRISENSRASRRKQWCLLVAIEFWYHPSHCVGSFLSFVNSRMWTNKLRTHF